MHYFEHDLSFAQVLFNHKVKYVAVMNPMRNVFGVSLWTKLFSSNEVKSFRGRCLRWICTESLWLWNLWDAFYIFPFERKSGSWSWNSGLLKERCEVERSITIEKKTGEDGLKSKQRSHELEVRSCHLVKVSSLLTWQLMKLHQQ